MATIQDPVRRCIWTDVPLLPGMPRIRIHPAFRRVTRGWPHPQRQRYADLARELGTLQHPSLDQLASQIRQEQRDSEAQRLDRQRGKVFDAALARDDS